MGDGILSGVAPLFVSGDEGVEILLMVGVSEGAMIVDPKLGVPAGRTYWYQK